MELQPGDMQFINNYHVLHGRTAYEDDRATGSVRHLKRLWLETEVLADRPKIFTNVMGGHWAKKASISRMDAELLTRPHRRHPTVRLRLIRGTQAEVQDVARPYGSHGSRLRATAG